MGHKESDTTEQLTCHFKGRKNQILDTHFRDIERGQFIEYDSCEMIL